VVKLTAEELDFIKKQAKAKQTNSDYTHTHTEEGDLGTTLQLRLKNTSPFLESDFATSVFLSITKHKMARKGCNFIRLQ